MADDGESARLTELLESFEIALKKNELQRATNALRQAASLSDSQDSRIDSAWDRLRAADIKKGAVALIKEYIVGRNEKSCSEAVRALQSESLSLSDAQESVDLILAASGELLESMDKLLAACIKNTSVQRVLAMLLQKKGVTANFENFWALGDAGMNALTTTLLAVSAWDDEQKRAKAEKDVCLLCLARLLEPGIDMPELAMGAIARLMAVDAERLSELIDVENLEILLNALDITNPIIMRSQATLATAKYLEVNPEAGTTQLRDYVVTRIQKNSNDDLVSALSAASAIFPIVPNAASPLFLSSGFVDDLLQIVSNRRSKRLHRASLELLSAACVDNACRDAIGNTFRPWLQKEMQQTEDESNSATAALVLSKIQASTSSGSAVDLVPMFKSMMIKSEEDTVRSSIEGLAYTSIQPSVKEKLANDEKFLKDLFKVVGSSETSGPVLFGGLTIISNLTTFRPAESAEQQKLAQLKAYANQSKPTEPDPLDNDEHVTERCNKVMNAEVVPILIKSSKRATPTTLNLISSIIVSLTKTPSHRGKAAQQGALDVVIGLSNIDPGEDAILQSAKRQSAMALSRILISIDPSLIFNTPQNRPFATAIRSLHTLLMRSDSSDLFTSASGPGQDLFIPFDALRAVTNLAGMSEEARMLIISTSWDAICGWLWSSASALTQAATECMTNLCLSETAIEKLASDKYKQNLTLLLALTTDKAKGTRYAAAAAFVHMTYSEAGVRALLVLKNGVEKMVELAADKDDSPLQARADAVLGNLNAVNGELGKEVEKRLAKTGGSSNP